MRGANVGSPLSKAVLGRYVPTLDGWRAVAVLAVVYSHTRPSLWTGAVLPDVPAAREASSLGRLGVDLFFAISGFLICGRLLAERAAAGRVSVRRFYLKRAFRILPAYAGYLAAVAALGLAGAATVGPGEVASCLVFVRNYVPQPDPAGHYTAHCWSLCVEEHFYLVWPLALVALGPRRAGWAAGAACLAVHAWRAADARYHLFGRVLPDAGLFFRTDARVDGILWGCVAALALPRLRRVVAAVGREAWAVPAAGIVGALAVGAPALPLLLAVGFAALIVATAVRPDSVAGRVLEARPLRWVGRLSYSLYLWHVLFLPPFGPSGTAEWLAAVQNSYPLNLCAAAAAAVASYYLIERPFVRLGHRLFGGDRPTAGPTDTPGTPLREASRHPTAP